MKNNRKALLLLMCAVLMVTASVFGTLAYLTDSESAVNTFTVGSVGIDLDEAKVNEMGVVQGTDRVKANEYRLLPGHTYTKDPIVYVDANSADCYVFVKVENGIGGENGIEAPAGDGYTQIEKQIIDDNKWIKLEGAKNADNVYYRLHTKSATKAEYPVFANFKIASTVDNTKLAAFEDATITVTAYAIQKDGFADAAAAWEAGDQSAANGGWNK